MLTKEDKFFIGHEVTKAVENDIKLLFPHQKSKDFCSGWFCADPLELIVTTNRTIQDFLSIFVHESCHMDQFLEKCPLWVDPLWDDDANHLWDYIRGEHKIRTKKVLDSAQISLKIELDCEKRAVAKIKKYGLSIDLDNYKKRGNSYLYSYRAFYDHRCWYDPKNKPYDNKPLVDKMPNKFYSFEHYWEGNDDVSKFLFDSGLVLV